MPTSVEPGQAAKAVTPKPTIGESKVQPSMQFQAQHGQQFPPEIAKLKFTLKKLHIIDPVIFSEEALLEPFECYIGETITLGQFQEIANQIATRYQTAGYVLTQVIIPPQNIKDGEVSLKVVAGFIDQVQVSGNLLPELKERLETYGERIKAGRPLQMKELERYTLLANDIPGVTVRAVLTPSKTTPAAADLLFISEQEYGSAYANVNNYGTRFLGPREYIVGGEINSLIKPGDSTHIQLVTTGNKELNFGELRHSELYGCEGTQVSGFGQYLKTRPKSFLSSLDLKGIYTVLGAEVLYPILRTREESLVLTGGFELLQSKAEILGMPLYNDRIRPVYAELAYDKLDNWKGSNHIEATVTQGLSKLFGASKDMDISRPNAKSAFTKLGFTLSRLQSLPYNLSVYFIVEGQYSCEKVLAAEQYSFGGSVLGRGYDPSELLGDQAIAGSIELRHNTINFEPLQFYVFYDTGKIWNRGDSFTPQASATSTGAGVRLSIRNHFQANLTVAKPLTREVAAFGNRRARGFFSFILKT